MFAVSFVAEIGNRSRPLPSVAFPRQTGPLVDARSRGGVPGAPSAAPMWAPKWPGLLGAIGRPWSVVEGDDRF